jgi:hypothetical protein
MVMSEDEFARKAREEYRQMSERDKERVSTSERSLRTWLNNLAKRIWQGAKDVVKGFIASVAAACGLA